MKTEALGSVSYTHLEVGCDVERLIREPLTGAAEADHDLVADHQDAVLVAQCAHAGQVAGRRHEHAVGAGDGLEHDRGDRVRALELDLLLEVRELSLIHI